MKATPEQVDLFCKHSGSFEKFALDLFDIKTTIIESNTDHFFETEQEHYAYLTWRLLFSNYTTSGVVGPTRDRCRAVIEGVRKLIDVLPYRELTTFQFTPFTIQTSMNRLSTVLYDPNKFRGVSLQCVSFIGMNSVKPQLVQDCIAISYYSLAAASWKGNEKLLFAD